MLENFSLEELLAEISKRKIQNCVPKILQDIDDVPLRILLDSYISDLFEGEIIDDDDEKLYIYEAVMITYFGEDIFSKINYPINSL